MGKTIRAGGSGHNRNVKALKTAKRSSRFEKDVEDVPNFKQMSAKIATETFEELNLKLR